MQKREQGVELMNRFKIIPISDSLSEDASDQNIEIDVSFSRF
jgi:hypothetical protein